MTDRNVASLAAATVNSWSNAALAVIITGKTDSVKNRAEFAQRDPNLLNITNLSSFDARITRFAFDYAGTGVISGLDCTSGTLDNADWSITCSVNLG